MSVPWQGFEPVSPDEEQPAPFPPEPEPLAPEAAEAAVDKMQPRAGRYYQKLKGLYGSIGLLVYPFDSTCGTAVIQSAEETARAMDRLARENAVIRRVVEAALKGDAFTAVIAAHTPIILAIISHHFPNVMERVGTMAAGMMSMGTVPSDDGEHPYS